MKQIFIFGVILWAALGAAAQPTITQAPANQTVALGGTLTLGVTASGTAPAYQWFKDSRLIAGATNSTLTVANAGVTNSGTYYVVVTNSGGMVISLPALVSVGNPSLLGWGLNGDGELGNGKNSNTNRPIVIAGNVVAGAAGFQHSLFVTADGTLWAMGYNGYGQLGNGTITSTNLPISVASNVVAGAAGYEHSLFVDTNGILWAMGYNQYGQLGNATAINTNRPVSVASNVVAAAAGQNHSLFVKADGTLWAMGYNNYGQLGNGTTINTNRPIAVASNVVAVAAGGSHSLFVTTDGTLWAMGYNQYGQLGNGTTRSTNRPIAVASNVAAAAGGGYHSLFIKTDGTLWAMGENNYGQLGNGDQTGTNVLTPASVTSNVVATAGGPLHSLFCKVDGTLWAMGYNSEGELGNGTTTRTNLPVCVTNQSVANVFPATLHSLALGINYHATVMLSNLSQFFTGSAISPTAATIPAGLTVNLTYNGSPNAPTNVGSYTVIGTISDPSYYGSATNTLVINPNATVALTNLNQAFTGSAISVTASTAPPGLAVNLTYNGSPNAPINPGNYNVIGTISDPNYAGSATNTLVITDPIVTPASQAVATGGTVTLSVSVSNPALPCQWFKDGRLIAGATNCTLTVANAGVTDSGTYYAAMTNTGGMVITLPALVAVGNPSLLAWGSNNEGQLGTNGTTLIPISVASNVVAGAAGWRHSLFVDTNGTLWTMGHNQYGQLGNGTNYSYYINTPTPTPVSVASNVVVAAAGQYHSLFVDTSGVLWGMGYNFYGQLGNGTQSDTNRPVSVASNVVAVAAGEFHSLFIKADGTLWGMGGNSDGQLGNGKTSSTNRPIIVATNVVAVAAGQVHSLYVTADGTLWAMGYNSYGQLGNGTTINTNRPVSVASNVMAVAGGSLHSFFIKTDGTLWAMGLNGSGQLGNGTNRPNANPIPINVASNAAAVAAGLYHSLFVKADGTLWAMGDNSAAQLGNGTIIFDGRPTPTPVNLPQLVVANVFPADQASHSLAIGFIKASATVTLGNLNQVYTGGAVSVTASTTPPGLTVNLTYNGSPNAPTNVGRYTVIGVTSDPNYYGVASNTLVIAPLIASPATQTVAVGGTVTLGVTMSSTTPAYQWFKDGRLIAGATNSTLTVANAGVTDSGTYHVVVTNNDGMVISLPALVSVGNPSLLAWGKNSNGQLGNGMTANTNLPTSLGSNVVAGAAGGNHSLFLTADGTLWAMGYNNFGQLGNGTFTEAHTPVSVASNVTAVAAGSFHSLFLKADGTLWAMGYNGDGEFGNGTTTLTNRPTAVASNVAAVAAGYGHTLFVKTDGTLWAMGYNSYGQLGNGTNTPNPNLTPFNVASNVVSVAAGSHHSLFVKADGTLWAMGNNIDGELGNGTTNNSNTPICVASNVLAAAAGYYHSLFVKQDGTLWATGNNQSGQLGNGTSSSNPNPTPTSVASNVVAVAAGFYHSMFTLTDGTFWATGWNGYGQLGNGTIIGTNRPISLPQLVVANVFPADTAYHSLAMGFLKASATVNLSNLNQLYTGNAISVSAGTTPPGLAVNLTYNGSPIAPTNVGIYNVVGTISDPTHYGFATGTLVITWLAAGPTNQAVAVGGTVTLGVTVTNTTPAYQWFKDGRLIAGAMDSTLALTNAGVTDSGTYQVVMTNNGGMVISPPAMVTAGNPTLLAWGYNNNGQLGNGTTINANLPISVASNVVAGAAGAFHSLFVKSDGRLWGMGNCFYGQLGDCLNPSASQYAPIYVASNVVAAAAGWGHSLFVTADGRLWTMGNNLYGQLGNGTMSFPPNPVPSNVASNVVAVAAGANHSLFLTLDGRLWAMGNNLYGQLGNGTTSGALSPVNVASNVVALAAGENHSMFVTVDGTLWAMGNNLNGQLGDGTTNSASLPISVASNVVAMAAGGNHTLFVDANGLLWAMGRNDNGQLGNGTTDDALTPVNVASNVMAAAAGQSHSLFTTTNGTLWGMGSNGIGQLGNGTTDNSSLPVSVPHVFVANVFQADQSYHSLAIGINYNATVTLTNLNQLYTGSAINVAASTTPPGLTVNLTYNGSPDAPTNAGSYTVVGVISDPNYYGIATNTLVVGQSPQGFEASSTNSQQLTLQLAGTPNYPYILESATNLTPPVVWQPVFTNYADTNGNWSFTITGLTNSPAGYYRAVAQ